MKYRRDVPTAGMSAVRSRLFRFLLAPMRGTVHTGTLFMAGLGVLIVDDNRLFLRQEERRKIIPSGRRSALAPLTTGCESAVISVPVTGARGLC